MRKSGAGVVSTATLRHALPWGPYRSSAGENAMGRDTPTSEASLASEVWPALPYDAWKDTYETLHMWTQIVGKIRLALAPWVNHSWHVTLYLTSRGLTTSPIPHGFHTFEIRFDFISHELRILKSDGARGLLPLETQSVASFYRATMDALQKLELPVKIDLTPNEITDPIPFDRDGNRPRYFKHLGLYAYRKAALDRFVTLPESSLEKIGAL
jgi:hypothetical protein